MFVVLVEEFYGAKKRIPLFKVYSGTGKKER